MKKKNQSNKQKTSVLKLEKKKKKYYWSTIGIRVSKSIDTVKALIQKFGILYKALFNSVC